MRAEQESERTAAARRLHDDIGQKLAAFRMACYGIAQQLSAEGGLTVLQDAMRRAADELHAAVPMIDEAILAVQEMSEDFHPALLQFGPGAAIEWQAERFQSRSGIACVADIDAEVGLSAERALDLYRIFTESLAIAARHEGVTVVEATLRQEAGEVVLRVFDDGQVPAPGESPANDLALLSIKERTRSAGGAFSFSGSAIEIRMPGN
jgi:signal transduction histidine kinase